MTEQLPPDRDELWAQEQAASIVRSQQKRAADRRLVVIIILIAVAVAAIYPSLIGIGPFGIKSFRAESVHLWVYNTTEQTTHVETSYGAPLAHEHVLELAPMGIGHLYLKAGRRRLKIETRGGTEKDSFNLSNDTIITTGDRTCYAVFDMSNFYDESKPADSDITLVDRVTAGTRMYVSTADTLVVPRQAMPRRAIGTVHWVEDFDCSLLAPEEEDTLMMRARVKLETREETLQEAMQR